MDNIDIMICETLYEEFKKTNYVTFNAMCDNIYYNIEYDTKITNQNNKIISETQTQISKLYQLDKDESLRLIVLFILSKKWIIYQEYIIGLKKLIKNSYQ